MTTQVSVTEFSRNLSDYLNRIAYRGERFALCRGKKVVAEIGPPAEPKTLSALLEFLRAGPHLPADDIEAFARDIEEGRAWVNSQGQPDKWA